MNVVRFMQEVTQRVTVGYTARGKRRVTVVTGLATFGEICSLVFSLALLSISPSLSVSLSLSLSLSPS